MKRSVINFFVVSFTLLAALAVPAQTAINFGSLPLGFEANNRPGSGISYVARGGGGQFSVSATGADFSLVQKDGANATVHMDLVGASPVAVLTGETASAGQVNYLLGNDPSQWRSGVPLYRRVCAQDVYPGVNVVYYGDHRQLEYDFNLAAGVPPSTISLRFTGEDSISIDDRGELVIRVGGSRIVQHAPEIYQMVGGWRHNLSGGYRLLDRHTATFEVGPHDNALPLVIDPVLNYSTFFGGTLGDFVWSAKLDGAGNVYVAGWTFSTLIRTNGAGFATPGAYQTHYEHGNNLGDGFVAKFGPTGSNLWTTYLGGTNGDNVVSSLALDSSNNIFVTGYTKSTNFPTYNSMYPATGVPGITNSLHISGSYVSYFKEYLSDGFVAELDNSGSNLLFSTYLGGSGEDAGYGIALDASNNIFVTGFTSSSNFPVTPNAYSPQLVCSNTTYYNYNAFLTELAPQGTNLNYSTYWGGINLDAGYAISCTNGYIVIGGSTASTNFPAIHVATNQVWAWSTNAGNHVTITNNYYFTSKTLNGATNVPSGTFLALDGFVSCFTNTGALLQPLYSTYLGGTNSDLVNSLVADGNGNAYAVGITLSTNFPYYLGTNDGSPMYAYNSNLDSYIRTNFSNSGFPATNSFLTKIQWNGATNTATLGFSVMFGGVGVDTASAIALAPDGTLFVAGSASSTNFPTTPANLYGSLQPTNASYLFHSDVILMAFSNLSPVLLYSTYLGGKYDEYAFAVAADAADDAYVVGQTTSTNFPTFSGAQSFLNGTNDLFLAKIIPAGFSLTSKWSGSNVVVDVPFTGSLSINQLEVLASTNLLSTNWTLVSKISGSTPVNFNVTPPAFEFTFNPTNPMEFFRLGKLF